MAELQRFSARLADLVTPEDAAREIAHSFLQALGAGAALVWLVDQEQEALVLAASEGYEITTINPYRRIRLEDPMPVCQAVKQGAPVCLESPHARRTRFPHLGDGRNAGFRSWLALPLLVARRVIGALSLSFVEQRMLSEEDSALLMVMCAHAAQVIERMRLYEAERRARAAAEAHAMSLERAESALRAESRSKDDFLAMLGHELRNPLAPIVTALELMKLKTKAGAAGVEAASLERERAVIERQVAHLTRLVDDLLDVARITRGLVELKREAVEAAVVLAKGIELASPLLERRRHRLSLHVPRQGLALRVDTTRVAQVLANLLTNAAKYTEPGGHIEVTARAEDGQAVFSVKDDGIGIAPELLPHLFDLFVQGPQSPDRAEGGLGLGLTLVRSLVLQHGGSVDARSEGHGRGSEFVVRLPLAQAEEHGNGASAPARPPAPGSLRVLVVDDNADAADMTAELLQVEGYEVRTAPDGPTALDLCEAFRPQVALLDIGLPVMDGYELASRIRAMECGQSVRLVAVTGYGQDSDRQRAFDVGFDEHLVKPLDLERLHQALRPGPDRKDVS